MHTSNEVRLGAALPRALSVTAKNPSPRSHQPLRIPNNCPVHRARVEDEVGDDACLNTRFACICKRKSTFREYAERRGWGRVSSPWSIYWHLGSYAEAHDSAQPRDFRGVTVNHKSYVRWNRGRSQPSSYLT
jgi:hypothetical protein